MQLTPYLFNEIVSVYADYEWPDTGQYYAWEKFEELVFSLTLK